MQKIETIMFSLALGMCAVFTLFAVPLFPIA